MAEFRAPDGKMAEFSALGLRGQPRQKARELNLCRERAEAHGFVKWVIWKMVEPVRNVFIFLFQKRPELVGMRVGASARHEGYPLAPLRVAGQLMRNCVERFRRPDASIMLLFGAVHAAHFAPDAVLPMRLAVRPRRGMTGSAAHPATPGPAAAATGAAAHPVTPGPAAAATGAAAHPVTPGPTAAGAAAHTATATPGPTFGGTAAWRAA